METLYVDPVHRTGGFQHIWAGGIKSETAWWIWNLDYDKAQVHSVHWKVLWQQTMENGRDFTEIMFCILSLFEINQVPAILSCKHQGQTNYKYRPEVFSLPRKQSRIERTAKTPTKTMPVMRTGLVKSKKYKVNGSRINHELIILYLSRRGVHLQHSRLWRGWGRPAIARGWCWGRRCWWRWWWCTWGRWPGYTGSVGRRGRDRRPVGGRVWSTSSQTGQGWTWSWGS